MNTKEKKDLYHKHKVSIKSTSIKNLKNNASKTQHCSSLDKINIAAAGYYEGKKSRKLTVDHAMDFF